MATLLAPTGIRSFAKARWWLILSPLGLGDFARLAGLPSVTIPPFVAVVDDDEALCEALVDLMRSIGYRAEPFGSAEKFLMSANRRGFNCIIADVHMPGMTGLELLGKLHEQGITTPVILITALPDKHLDDEAVSTGAFCLLRKPFKTRSLLDHLERSFRK
jgi:FixJ family two-component response regulator